MNSRNAYYLVLKTGISNLKLEKIISQDCHYSYLYAKYVLRGRFELGELIISKSSYYSCNYAKNVLKGRFELGENSIMKTPYGVNYLINAMGYNHE